MNRTTTPDTARTHLMRWAVDLLVLLLPLSLFWPLGPAAAPGILPQYVAPGLYLSDLAVGVILLLGLLQPEPERSRPRWLLPLLMLPLLALLTLPWALSGPLALYTAARWALAVGLYVTLSGSPLSLVRVVTVFTAGLVGQTLIGLGQVVVQGPLGLPGELALRVGQTGAVIIETPGGHWLRAYGLTFHPNVLGGFLAVGLGLLLPLLTRGWARALWGVLWLGLLLSFSRGAWLAAALALGPASTWLGWQRPAWRRPLAQAGLVAAGVALATVLLWPQQMGVRLRPLLSRLPVALPASPSGSPGTEQFSLDARDWMNQLARELIAERPLTGVGAGNFPLAMQRTGIFIDPQFAHNVPLLLAAEVGVAGGLAWVGIAGGLAWLAWRRRTPWEVATLAAGGVLVFVSLVDSYPWALNAGRLLTVVVLALSDHAAAKAQRPRREGEGVARHHRGLP